MNIAIDKIITNIMNNSDELLCNFSIWLIIKDKYKIDFSFDALEKIVQSNGFRLDKSDGYFYPKHVYVPKDNTVSEEDLHKEFYIELIKLILFARYMFSNNYEHINSYIEVNYGFKIDKIKMDIINYHIEYKLQNRYYD
jgi:hypothetical protein